jgi:hypothetical protein
VTSFVMLEQRNYVHPAVVYIALVGIKFVKSRPGEKQHWKNSVLKLHILLHAWPNLATTQGFGKLRSARWQRSSNFQSGPQLVSKTFNNSVLI